MKMLIFADEMKYNTYTLDNGLRIIHLPSQAQVVYCGYRIGAGARHEAQGDEGLAHFCEHTTFKGTARRKASDILNYLESVGGDLNAYTNKEDTTYYAAILKEHTGRAVDLLSDMVFHSIYPQQEIDKEVEVICDEIESYNDSPAELIYDEFENLVFKGHPLGHNILGSTERVRQYTTQDALRFTRQHYCPDNAVFFAYGDIDFQKLVKRVEKCTADLKAANSHGAAGKNMPLVNSTSEGTHIIDKHTHQAHVMLGHLAYDIFDDRRIALYLLNNIIGGPGMNAKLNVALREKHGLVYTVESTMTSYSDTGLWCVYLGCDEHDISRCLKLTRNVVKKFIETPMTDRQLAAAKKQIKGQIGVACDNRENFALDFSKSFLHYGWEKDVTALFQQIDAVTAQQIQQTAQAIMDPEHWTTLIYK